MPSEMVFLLAIAIVVTILVLALALIGFITVVRAIFRGTSASVDAGVGWCPWCNQKTHAGNPRCDWCGRRLDHPASQSARDLVALAKLLNQFRNQPWLGPEAADRLMATIQRQRESLRDELTAESAPDHRAAAGEIVLAEFADESVRPAATAPVATAPAATPPVATPPVRTVAPQPSVPPPPPPPSPPPPPRKTFLETIVGFLEERNIPVGELVGLLVGGLLVVGSSIALVISFREKVESLVYLKYAIFTAVSSLIFGVALYAFHRWKLEATGRGMLMIATLLVPLNFLAMTSMSEQGRWSLGMAAVEAFSLVVFTGLVAWSAKTLVPDGFRLQTFGVVGGSLAMLAIAHGLGPECRGWTMTLAGLAPTLIFCAATIPYVLRVPRRLDAAGATHLLTLTGLTAFTATIGLGLLAAWGGRDIEGGGMRVSLVLPYASPWGALMALPLLAAGLTLVRTTRRDAALAGYRTTGTAMALGAVALCVAALAAAWPSPISVFPVAVLTAAVAVWTAVRYRFPAAHVGAVVAASEAWLLVYPLATRRPLDLFRFDSSGGSIFRETFSAPGGAVMLGLVAVLGVAAWVLARSAGVRHARPYAVGAAIVAALSAATVTQAALFSNAETAAYPAVMYAVYAALALAAGAIVSRPGPVYAGLALAVGATLWTLRWTTGELTPVWGATLALESLVAAAACAAAHVGCGFGARPLSAPAEDTPGPRRNGDGMLDCFRLPLAHAAEATGLLALVLAAVASPADDWQRSPVHLVAPLALAAVWLILAWGHRTAQRTWFAMGVLFAGALHAAAFNYAAYVEWPYVLASLGHAAAATVAAALLRIATRNADPERNSDRERVFITPLLDAASVTSVVGLAAMFFAGRSDYALAAKCLYGLAALWLAIGWMRRRPEALGGGQAACFAAGVVAVMHYLSVSPQAGGRAVGLAQPQAFQAYGIVLAATCLAWQGLRLTLWRLAQRDVAPEEVAGRRKGIDAACHLLQPPYAAVDVWVRHAVVVLHCGLLMVAAGIGSVRELSLGAASTWQTVDALGGPTAWWLLAVTAVVAASALWRPRGRADVGSAMLVAASLPLLAAVACDGPLSAATALRWFSAIYCVAGTAAICCRRRLAEAADRIGGPTPETPAGGRLAEVVLAVAGMVPVVACSAAAGAFQLLGVKPSPSQGVGLLASLIENPSISYLVPLLLVTASLGALAIRQHASGYALAGGCAANMTVVFGYVLSHAPMGTTPGPLNAAVAMQWATITAGVWALIWTAARHAVAAWRDDPADRAGRVLMRAQLAMAVAGLALGLTPSLAALIWFDADWFDAAWDNWAVASGETLGWFSLIAAFAALGFDRFRTGRSISPTMVGWAGMVTIGVLACTVWNVWPEWGYRTLMLGWATYALLVVAATWWVAGVRTAPDALGPPQGLVRAASGWVSAAGVLAVLLGLKAALLHPLYDDMLWGSAAIAVAGMACATMAFWRRNEGWAFAAGLGVNLAASLIVWYYHAGPRFGAPWGEWWVLLLEANAIATAAVALVWLAARRRLYQLRELSVRGSPLLAVQVTIGAAAMIVALAPAVVRIVAVPETPALWCGQLAATPGWIALVLLAAAAGWYVLEVSRRDVFHVAAATLLCGSVLAACAIGRWDAEFADSAWLVWLGYHGLVWPAYHALLIAWTASGAAIAAAQRLGWIESLAAALARRDVPAADEAAVAGWIARGWTDVACGAVLVAALCHVGGDPAGPWWTAGPVLALSVVIGVVAVWHRLADYVFVSGALVNIAGSMVWYAAVGRTAASAIEVNALCLAIGASLWSIVGFALRDGVPSRRLLGVDGGFRRLAAVASIALTAAVVVGYLALDLAQIAHRPPTLLSAAALVAALVAAALALRDRHAGPAMPAFYALAVTALGMGLAWRQLPPTDLIGTAGCELAAFAVVAALAAWGAERLVAARFVPARFAPWCDAPSSGDWWVAAQSAVVGVVSLLGAWIAIDPRFDTLVHPQAAWLGGRIAGAIALGTALAAAVLTAQRAGGRFRQTLQYLVCGVGLLAAAAHGWALLPSDVALPGLHRWIVLLAATAAGVVATGLIVPRVLPTTSDWIGVGRRAVPAIAATAIVVLSIILVLEFRFYEPFHGVAIQMWAKLVAAAAILGLAAACVAFAVWPQRDPLPLSETGRQGYVYAAELLIFFTCLHFRMTWPDLFRLEIMRHYWMLIMMGVAFVGAGLAEWFQRRKLPILALPLIRTAVMLPLAPALAFFFLEQAVPPGTPPLGGASPTVWFLAALFYAFLAVTKQRVRFAAAGIVALNIGLAVLWQRLDWGFFDRPQLWLIPPALCILAAEYLNHHRLSAAASAAFRYLALSMIYVSSTAEYFPALGQSIVLPLVLIVLSLAGIFAGVLLRIRSFLFMGLAFLLVVIVSMIVQAGREQTWILWICCILLGLTIISAVGLYEKHRPRFLAAIRQLKAWQR